MFIPVKMLPYDETDLELAALVHDDHEQKFLDGLLCIPHVSYLRRHETKNDRIYIGLLSGAELTVQGTLEEVSQRILMAPTPGGSPMRFSAN
ncbi:hypothetical protein [Salmonirosea aquatica]|uniref:Uncharacterized protein n=1 Tax=Salmonirosea aquatica TaxID=2654236 RepID=A0A7C9FFF5_9BACT|nr:hypothetical protein [Cytophagaceae bacterium SJW1-29]